MHPRLAALLDAWSAQPGDMVVLTGAGISAESGIPTFRGRDGYWTVGSTNHAPMEMATLAMFERAPAEVWAWYLDRFGRFADAQPNDAHRAIVDLEHAFGERVVLITQNIDGLHHRAGSTGARTFAIHGEAAKVRCSAGCGIGLRALASETCREAVRDRASMRAVLSCPRCGAWARPHVLWFDEYYTERWYRSDSALVAAHAATLLLVVGTTGSTTLPMRIATACARRGVPIIDINIEDNVFGDMAASHGVAVRERASVILPQIARHLVAVPG